MQRKIPCTIMRGGTSKALFFRREDLPDDIAAQDRILLAALGNPDPYARLADGLGGTISSTNKVAIIGPRQGEANTVEYTFGQGNVDKAFIDRAGNCGNISSAVGPYAVDEGLVEAREPETVVRIYNTNTRKYIVAHVPVEGKHARVEGDYRIAGMPGTGARVALDFESPGGSVTGNLLPTGHAREILQTGRGAIEVSLVDAANPFVFVRAADLGLTGVELPSELNARADLLLQLESIRAAAAVAIGMACSSAEATQKSPAVPKIAFVSPSADHRMTSGMVLPAAEIDLVARMLSMGKVHGAYPITGAVGTAGAACIEGSLVAEMMREGRRSSTMVTIGHPSGSVEVDVRLRYAAGQWHYERGTVLRTARRIMDGYVYIPAALLP